MGVQLNVTKHYNPNNERNTERVGEREKETNK